MPLALTCPHCTRNLKVGDDFAGRKIRCPECKTVFVAQAGSEQAIQAEALPSPKTTRDVPEADPPKRFSGRGVVHTDLTGLNDSFNNFDVSRFTIVGWLLFVVALGAGFAGWWVVDTYYDQILDVPVQHRGGKRLVAAYAIGITACGMGAFFLLWGVFWLIGVRVIRAKDEAV